MAGRVQRSQADGWDAGIEMKHGKQSREMRRQEIYWIESILLPGVGISSCNVSCVLGETHVCSGLPCPIPLLFSLGEIHPPSLPLLVLDPIFCQRSCFCLCAVGYCIECGGG